LRWSCITLAGQHHSGVPVTGEDLKATLKRARAHAHAMVRHEELENDLAEANTERVAARAALRTAKQEHSHDLATVAVAMVKHGAAHVAVAPVLLSVVIEAFVRESRDSAGKWSPKTAERWDVTFRLLRQAIGDPAISQIRRDQISDFLLKLRRMPANARKHAPLAELSFPDLVQVTGYPTISSGTADDHMTRLKGFFKWVVAVGQYGLVVSPAVALAVAKVKRTARRPFTLDELTALFSHEHWTSRRFLHPHYYWLMPIGLLTGMRIAEVCQLNLVDFVVVDGVHVIKCADLAEGQSGKNPNSTRRVPIHRELIELGLLRWVEKVRSLGHKRLFPEIKRGRDGYGQDPSKWFGRYRASCGIQNKQATVFHSFRHGFISSRLSKGISQHFVAAVAGHETGWITGDTYWSDREAQPLRDAVVDAVGLPDQIRRLIPAFEEVRFEKPPRRPPSRLGAQKTRLQRAADASKRSGG